MLRSRITDLESARTLPVPAPAPGAVPAPAPGAPRPGAPARPTSPPAAERPTLAPPAPAPAPGPRTHVVKAGETLSSIANKVYNDSSAWRKIFEANQDQLTSPAAIREGQVLVIP